MDADLVRASRVRMEFDPASYAVRRLDRPSHFIVRDGGLAVRIGLHFPAGALARDFGKRQLDAALLLAGTAVDDGPIGLAHLAVRKHVTDVTERLRVTAKDETS